VSPPLTINHAYKIMVQHGAGDVGAKSFVAISKAMPQ
jgi:hypothetical protein